MNGPRSRPNSSRPLSAVSVSRSLPEEIGDATPLFGEGLGLDSIDVLEIVLELERSFGVQIRDEQTGSEVLQSIDTMADFVMRYRDGKLRLTARNIVGDRLHRYRMNIRSLFCLLPLHCSVAAFRPRRSRRPRRDPHTYRVGG